MSYTNRKFSWDFNKLREFFQTHVKGAIKKSIKTDGSAYDVSVHFPTSGVDDGNTYTLPLALNVLNTNLSADEKYGGMTIRFVDSSDNKYVQYRLMSDSFNTTVANWQGVDDEPIPGSENVVKSGGVANQFINTGKLLYTILYPDGLHYTTPFIQIAPNSNIVWHPSTIDNSIFLELYDAEKRYLDRRVATQAEINTSPAGVSYIRATFEYGGSGDIIVNGNTVWDSSLVNDNYFDNEIVNLNNYKSRSKLDGYSLSIKAVARQGAAWNPNLIPNVFVGETVRLRVNFDISLPLSVGINYTNGTNVTVNRNTNENIDIPVIYNDSPVIWAYISGSNMSQGGNIETICSINGKFDLLEKSTKDLESKIKAINEKIIPNVSSGYGIDYSTGEVVEYSAAKVSELISCTNITSFYLERETFEGLVFYDEDGNKIKPVGRTTYAVETTTKTITVPNNAVKFRFSTSSDINVVIKNGLPDNQSNTIIGLDNNNISFGNTVDVRWFANNMDGFVNPITGNDNAAGFNYAIAHLTKFHGGKICVPSSKYSISSPILLNFGCINIEGEIWNYPSHPNGVYESPNGTKIKIASQNIPAMIVQRTNDTDKRADGFRIAQIGFAGTIPNGATKGTFSLDNIEKNCGVLVKSYIDQYVFERVSCEGLAAGFVCNDGGFDAGVIKECNADGCNIGMIIRKLTASGGGYYAKFHNNILSDCPAFGLYVDGGDYSYTGFEFVGNVMVRNGGGFTNEQLNEFGGDSECAAVVVKGISNGIFSRNTITNAGIYNNTTNGSVVQETQTRIFLIFDGTYCEISNNILTGNGEKTVIRGLRNNVYGNTSNHDIVIEGNGHHIHGNYVANINIVGNYNLIEGNYSSTGIINVSGNFNTIIAPNNYTVNDSGNSNTIIRLC